MMNVTFFRTAAFAILFAFLTFAMACSSDDGAQSCEVSEDCASGQICEDGTCRTAPSCETDGDCSFGLYCAEGVCADALCSDDDECVGARICAPSSSGQSMCRIGCRENDDCPEGNRCLPGSQVCEAVGCTTGSCPSFQTCNRDLEPAACQYTGECNSDVVCTAYGRQVGDGEEYICSQAQQRCIVRPPCSGDGDCGTNQICAPRAGDGRMICRTGCRENQDCAFGQICAEDQGNICVNGCVLDSDCDQSEGIRFCLDLVCTPGCNNRNDCPIDGQICAGNPNVCQSCRRDDQCIATQFCDRERGATAEEVADPTVGLCADIPAACPDDPYGNNHSQENAYAITNFPFDPSSQDQPYFCRENQGGDWFSIQASSGDVVEIIMEYEVAGNLDVALRNADGVELALAADPADIDQGREHLRYGVALGQTLYIQVRGAILGQNTQYRLFVNVEPAGACMADALEPNSEANPRPIQPETDYTDLEVCGNDADFYQLAVESNQIVRVRVDAPISLGQVDLYLRNSSGEIVAQNTEAVSAKELLYQSTTPGTYVLEARVATSVGNISYSLEWSQRDNQCADIFEPNDTCAEAAELVAGQFEDLNICTDLDWYFINLLPLETVTFRARFDPSQAAGDLDLTFFGPNDCARFIRSGTIQPVEGTNFFEEVITYQTQNGGRYYLLGSLFAGLNVPYTLFVDVEPGPECIGDGLDNQQADDAFLIDRDLALTGQGNVLTGLKLCDLDQDWFAMDLQEGDELQWQVSFRHSMGDIDAYLIGPDQQTVLDAGISTTDDEIVSYTVGEGQAGRYYLRVEGKFPARNDYWLLTTLNGVSTPNPECPDQFELNGSAAEAAEVQQGSYDLLVCGTPRHDDWFRTFVQAGDTIRVDLFFSHSQGNIDLRLYSDQSQTTPVASSTSNTDNEHVVYTTARDQWVYWEVWTSSNAQFSPYTMVVDIESSDCQDDRLSGNQDPANAYEIDVPWVYNRLTKCEQESDWFAVDLEAGRLFEAFIVYQGSLGALQLEVYGPDQTTLLGSSVEAGNNQSVVVTPTSTGRHYVRVTDPASGAVRLNYELVTLMDINGDGTINETTKRECPDPYEPNDLRNNAAQLSVGTYENLFICWMVPGIANDNDYYTVFVPAGATLTVELFFEHAAGNVNGRILRRGSPTAAATGNSTDDNEFMEVTNDQAGAFYDIHVSVAGSNIRTYYDMDISLSFADDCTQDSVSARSATEASPAISTDFYQDLQVCEGSDDWFALPAGTTSVEAYIQYASRLGDLDLALHDGSGVLVTSASTGNTDAIFETSLSPSTQYYLRVYPKGDAFVRNAYDLWVSVDGGNPPVPWCPDDYERNDAPESAFQLNNGAAISYARYADMVACGLDRDYYLVNLLGSRNFEVLVFYEAHPGADLTLDILNPAGDVIASSDTAGDDQRVAFSTTSTGNYFIRVENLENGQADYKLQIMEPAVYTNLNICLSAVEDAFEPNDNLSNAIPITLPFKEPMGLCGNDDYFRFTAPSSDPITVTVEFDGSRMSGALWVYDFTGLPTPLAYVESQGENRMSATVTVAEGTPLRVGVERIGQPLTQGPYFLTIE